MTIKNPTSSGKNSFGKSISFSTISVKLSLSLRVLSSNESEPSLPGDKQEGPRWRPRLRISLSISISVNNRKPLKFSVVEIKSNFGSYKGIANFSDGAIDHKWWRIWVHDVALEVFNPNPFFIIARYISLLMSSESSILTSPSVANIFHKRQNLVFRPADHWKWRHERSSIQNSRQKRR